MTSMHFVARWAASADQQVALLRVRHYDEPPERQPVTCWLGAHAVAYHVALRLGAES